VAAKLQIVRNYIGSCMTRYLRRRLRSALSFHARQVFDVTQYRAPTHGTLMGLASDTSIQIFPALAKRLLLGTFFWNPRTRNPAAR
jgi:hypothetical protein